MAVTAGALSQVSVGANKASLVSAAATAGTGPYTYQWYRSTTTGFTPGGGNIISGATSLTLNDSGLIPNTTYYYKVVATDTGAGNATSASSQLAVTTTPASLEQNSFAQSIIAGTVDLRFPSKTLPVVVHSSQATAMRPGQAVKFYDSTDGVPAVVACAANADDCAGFLNFDGKSQSYAAGQAVEMSAGGNCVYLHATAAVSRGVRVCLDLAAPASVRAYADASSGDAVVGWAYDKATVHGQIMRVMLETPAFTKKP